MADSVIEVKSEVESEKFHSESDVEETADKITQKSETLSRRHRRCRRVLSIDGLVMDLLNQSVSETDSEQEDDVNLIKSEQVSIDGLVMDLLNQSVSETDSEQEDDVNLIKSEQASPSKVGDGSEYESAEEEDVNKVTDKKPEELPSKDQESLSELVDEEGGEEGIAETEDVEGDFLSGEQPDEGDGDEGSDEYADEERQPGDDVDEGEEGSEEGEYVEEERQQGDGEECSPTSAVMEKELDFDEDRRNPQYIPKKGIFYEHDDRNNEDVKEKEEEPARDRKKKLWLDEGRWGHDRFRLEEQYPKSRHELIETYGYDIRNEDGPPRARRRRRYGRGPTKYERNWEDVSAYGREKFKGNPRGFSRERRSSGRFRGAPRFRGRGRKQFSSEDSNKDNVSENAEDEENPLKENNDVEIKDNLPVMNSNEFPALPSKEIVPESETTFEKRPFFQKSSSEAPENKSVRTLTFENSNLSGRNSLERDIPVRSKPTYGHQHDRGSRRPAPRGIRGSNRGDHIRRGRGGMRHISPRFLENKVNNINADMEHLNIDDAADVCNGVNTDKVRQLDNDVVPSVTSECEITNVSVKGAGDSSSRPKRYSSLRQRSLPETTSYQTSQPAVPSQPAPYFEGGYQPALYAPTNTGVPTPSTQSQSATSPPLINPSGFHPYDCGIRLQLLPRALIPQPTFPAGQSVLAPPPPSPCIPPPTPNLIDFAAPPSGYHQFAYQQYAQPAPPPPPPTAPNEIYQPGITYYFAQQTQSSSARPTVQKRPKAAIPILPPPERESKKADNKEITQVSNNSSRNSSNEAVNGEISLRTEAPSQSQLPSVGVES